MREFQLAVRQFLFEELSKKYDCKIGSDFQDISYVDFAEAIQINHKDLKFGPVHVCICTDDTIIEILVYSPPTGSGGRSHCFNHCVVDLPAPNFGNLVYVIDGFIQKAIWPTNELTNPKLLPYIYIND